MPAKLNYPSGDRSPVEDKSPLDLPFATELSPDDIIVVIKDPSGTPTAKAATLSAATTGGTNDSSGSGEPPAPPPNPAALAFYVDEDTDTLYYWKYLTVETPHWVPLLG